eukprot:1372680-Prymnesium_polylepis.1
MRTVAVPSCVSTLRIAARSAMASYWPISMQSMRSAACSEASRDGWGPGRPEDGCLRPNGRPCCIGVPTTIAPSMRTNGMAIVYVPALAILVTGTTMLLDMDGAIVTGMAARRKPSNTRSQNETGYAAAVAETAIPLPSKPTAISECPPGPCVHVRACSCSASHVMS